MNPLLRGSDAHLLLGSIETPELDGRDLHHLTRVLRLRDGAAVTVSDGRGSWRSCRLVGGALVSDGPVQSEPEPRPVRIAAAIPKGDRLEWMVQKLTEVGATEICLLDCERSVTRWSAERALGHLDRLERIVREAAMQARRVHLPLLDGPRRFAEVAGRPGAALAEPGGDAVHDAEWLLIGPEGGFSPGELAVSPLRVALGEQILRVETAAVVGAVLLRHRG